MNRARSASGAPQNSNSFHARQASERDKLDMEELQRWVDGRCDQSCYRRSVHRTPNGEVLSMTIDDVIFGCPRLQSRYGPSARAVATKIGFLLTRLRWTRRQVRRDGGRQVRHFRPLMGPALALRETLEG